MKRKDKFLEKDLEEQVQGEVTQRLQENSSQRNAQIQDALQRTYGRALKERAKTLGQVVEQHESEENGIYELKITIELYFIELYVNFRIYTFGTANKKHKNWKAL